MFSRTPKRSGATTKGTGTSMLTLLMPLLMSGKLGRRFGAMSLWKKALVIGGATMIAKRAQTMKQRNARQAEASRDDAMDDDSFRTPL